MQLYATVLLFCAFAYSFWFNLLGLAGAAVLLGVVVVSAAGVWIGVRKSRARGLLRPSALPWAALAYVGVAAVSLAWSRWPSATATTWILLAGATCIALFLADTFELRRIVLAAERALIAIIGMSAVLEVWVAARGYPLLPNFTAAPSDPDPHWYWVRGNLFEGIFSGGRVQGIVGNANLFAVLCLLGLTISLVQITASRRGLLIRSVMIALSLALFVRCGSATMYVAALGLVVLVVAWGLLRAITSSRARTVALACGVGVIMAVAGIGVVFHTEVLEFLGRNGTLMGRADIWARVLQRALEAPIMGNGFSSPWLPWDTNFSSWIFDHGIVVFQAHNMWLDVFMQLGGIGVLCVTGVVISAVIQASRSFRRGVQVPGPWFSVDALRHLLPAAVLTVLLVQGMTESSPVMLWGWMLLTVLSMKLHVGHVNEVASARREANRTY